MITRIVLIQIFFAAITFFSQPLLCQAQSHHVAFEIVGYDIDLGRNMISDLNMPQIDARIRCHGKGGSIDILFLPTGAILPPNSTRSPIPGGPGWYGVIYASRDQYVWFVDILRNEKTVAYLFTNPADPRFNRITGSGMAGWGHPK